MMEFIMNFDWKVTLSVSTFDFNELHQFFLEQLLVIVPCVHKFLQSSGASWPYASSARTKLEAKAHSWYFGFFFNLKEFTSFNSSSFVLIELLEFDTQIQLRLYLRRDQLQIHFLMKWRGLSRAAIWVSLSK